MKLVTRLASIGVFLAAASGAYVLGAASSSPSPQDPVKVSPDIYKVALDNDRVRVLDITLKPGAKSPMHSHPDYVAYLVSEGKVKFTDKDGKTEERELKKGTTVWFDAMSHAVENVGTTELHVLNVELKEPKPAKK